jgi:hypothetical protein
MPRRGKSETGTLCVETDEDACRPLPGLSRSSRRLFQRPLLIYTRYTRRDYAAVRTRLVAAEKRNFRWQVRTSSGRTGDCKETTISGIEHNGAI